MTEPPTPDEVDAARTERGGWRKEDLERWGVPWPPPRGWKKKLLEGRSFDEPTIVSSTPRKFPDEDYRADGRLMRTSRSRSRMIPCPDCGAGADAHCRNSDGTEREASHHQRHVAYVRSREAGGEWP